MKAYYVPKNPFQRSPQYYTQQIPSLIYRSTSRSPNLNRNTNNQSPPKCQSLSHQQQKSQSQQPLEQSLCQSSLLQQNYTLKQQLHGIILTAIPSYARLIEQQEIIKAMINKIKENNGQIVKMQQIRKEIQIRINNIMGVDRKIYGILNTTDSEDVARPEMCLAAAKQALEKGEDRQIVIAILKNILK